MLILNQGKAAATEYDDSFERFFTFDSAAQKLPGAFAPEILCDDCMLIFGRKPANTVNIRKGRFEKTEKPTDVNGSCYCQEVNENTSAANLPLLIAAAHAAMQKGYAPYSKNQIGASILAEDGHIYSGSNFENTEPCVNCCAETSAIAAMISARQSEIVALAVLGIGRRLCTPCSCCRQRIREFAVDTTPIYICNQFGLRQETTMIALLPPL